MVTLRVTWRYSLFKYIISYYLDHWAFSHVLLCQSISVLCGVQSDILSRYFSGILIFLLSFKVLCFEYECVLLNECLKTSDLGYGYNQYVRCPSVCRRHWYLRVLHPLCNRPTHLPQWSQSLRRKECKIYVQFTVLKYHAECSILKSSQLRWRFQDNFISSCSIICCFNHRVWRRRGDGHKILLQALANISF